MLHANFFAYPGEEGAHFVGIQSEMRVPSAAWDHNAFVSSMTQMIKAGGIKLHPQLRGKDIAVAVGGKISRSMSKKARASFATVMYNIRKNEENE